MWFVPLNCALALECLAKDSMPGSDTSEALPDLWVMSNGTPTLRPPSWPRWKNRPWSQRLYGRETFRMCDGSNGMAAWIASWRDSHASRTAWPEAEKARTTIGGSGLQLRTAFAELSPDSSSWRTYPAFDLLGDSPLYSQTWPRSGSVSNGLASERPTLELAINGSEFSSLESSWMTPMVPSGGRSVSAEVVASKGKTERGKRTVGLESQVRHLWATPDCNTSTKSNGLMGPNIREQVANWPTPDANLYKGAVSEKAVLRKDGKSRMDRLDCKAIHGFLPQDQTATNGPQSSETSTTSRPRLNPAFGCWLMGWPWFWTNPGKISFAASEMALFRSRLQSHLSILLGEQESLEDAA